MAIDSPAIAHNNLSNLWIFEYMRENMDSWLEFANTRPNLDLDEQDIVFVSRTIKTTRWASPGEECRGDSEERCVSEQPRSESPRDGGPRFAGRPFPVSHSGAGPTGASSGVLNQCLGIDYYKMKRRTSGEEQAPERASFRSSCDLKHEVESEDSGSRDSEPGYDPVGPLLDYILQPSLTSDQMQNSDSAIAIASNTDVTELLQASG